LEKNKKKISSNGQISYK